MEPPISPSPPAISGETRISADGQSWTLLGATTLTDLAPTIHVGFAACSNTGASSPLTGWHSPLDARASTTSDPVPAPPALFGARHWQPNAATWTPRPDGTTDFSVSSGDLWNSADRGSFHARAWTGDGEFVTWLGDFSAALPWAKAGLMLRAHSGDSSRHASLHQTAASGISFQRRSTDGGGCGATTVSTGPATSHPWLRLVRSGNTVTASSSLDGRVWENRGSVTFASLPATVLVGHAVGSLETASPASGHFGPLTARPLTATEIIPGAHLSPHTPHPEDPLDTGLPESWMLAHGLDPQNPFGPNGPHGDPDNDGLDNLAECQLGSDPSVPSPVPGSLTRELWTNVTGKTIHDLVTHSRFHEAPNEVALVPGVDFDVSDWGLPFGARYRGAITPAITGTYRFWITGDDHAELWLADGTVTPRGESTPRTDRFGKRRIAWIEDERFGKDYSAPADFDHHPSQRSVAIHLQAGKPYFIEVLHKAWGEAVDNREHVTLAWQPPGQVRHTVPAQFFHSNLPSAEDSDDNGLPDSWQNTPANNLADSALTPHQRGQYGDPDADGLINLLEYQYGAKPRTPDTDEDNLTDHDEIFLYGTDPLVSNSLPSTPITGQPVTHTYASATGGWTANPDGSLSAWDRRGEITYTFTTTQAGIHEIVLTGSAIGDIRPVEHLPITFTLNGADITTSTLTSNNGSPGTLRTLTPLLPPGAHSLTILHDNYRTARRLKIHSIEILRLGGEDLNENGIPDWAEQNSLAANTLTRIPSASRTSPVSIEGITQNLSTATISYSPPAASEPSPLPLTRSINDSFFTDVPLSQNGATTLTSTFLGGVLPPGTHTIDWTVTNPFDLDQSELHIRQGDSLLLDAWSEAGADGQPFTVTLDSVPLQDPAENTTHTSGIPFAAAFDTPGSFTLTATHGGQSATLTLHVHAAHFGPAHSVRAYSLRPWTPTLLGPTHLIEADDRLTLAETTADPEIGPRTFRAAVHHAGNRHTIARLPHDVDGAPSAILARGTVHGFYLAYLDETTDPEIIHRYDDGTWLMRGTMVAVNLPPDILIRLTSILQGTVFHNGDDTLWLDHTHFNANGIASIHYEWAGSGAPRLCNRLQLFLNQP